MSPSILLNVFAVLGVVVFTYLVYSKGLVPVAQGIVSWWNRGKIDAKDFINGFVALEARVRTLEASVGIGPGAAKYSQPVTATALPQTPSTPPASAGAQGASGTQGAPQPA